MLQFLKKSATVRKKSGIGIIPSSEDSIDIDAITICHSDVTTDEEALAEAEKYYMEQHPDTAEMKSRLSRNLMDILAEQSCFCYFVQFLETKEALPLIKFWLDVESFKAAALESLKSANKNEIFGKSVNRRTLDRSVSSDGFDSLSLRSVDCDSISTFSENVFDEGTGISTMAMTDPESDRTSGACTPCTIPLEVVVEEDKKPEPSMYEDNDDRKRIIDMRDLALRQSLTDDEKTHIFEKNKLKLEEPKKSTSGYNSLIDSDAVRIYRKYLISNSPYHIEVPATVLSSISLALCGGTCSERIFETAQQYLLEVLERNYLNEFLNSGFYLKYTFEVLSSNSLGLRDILCSEMALFYFMEFLEQKNKRHILEFCVTASHFRKSAEGTQSQADALVLYEKYFSLQATCPLNLSDKVRFLLEENICSQDTTTIKNCFELPSRIIERFLERRYFQEFLKSSLYKNYLSELLGRIKITASGETTSNYMGILAGPKQVFMTDRTNTPGHKRGHRKTYSDVTNDSTNRSKHSSFVSSQNTLLAMSDANFHRKRPTSVGCGSTSTGTDIMQIDSRQLYNPDLLWKRNSASGLTFGRVDALGRYERDSDIAEPPQGDDRWSKNRLKRAMRKLVNLPEDKAQEELAWQVAEMIVNDITSITMNHGTEDAHET
ncbi:A-kinase anchor protein 10, mitochondrial [Malaya genurostris]|uniref:A-kinase anchor protein 10, mitochondrial n=1 Tax=Malaya genurostris TaxID=325434 RepID=UPI0026F3E3A2|nr:A-kinase anchor protein 10, mitochondrial [Malaya genurostris]